MLVSLQLQYFCYAQAHQHASQGLRNSPQDVVMQRLLASPCIAKYMNDDLRVVAVLYSSTLAIAARVGHVNDYVVEVRKWAKTRLSLCDPLRITSVIDDCDL